MKSFVIALAVHVFGEPFAVVALAVALCVTPMAGYVFIALDGAW